MILWSELAGWEQARKPAGQIRHQLLLIPEAPALLALLLVGWAWSFPPAIGALAAFIVTIFVLRLLLLSSAAQQLERAAYSQADRLTRAALRIYPWSADALALRAHGLFLQGEDAAAEALLRRAVRLAPDSDVIHSALAGVLLARGEWPGGRAHAAYAAKLAAGSPYAARHLAWLALHVEGDPIAAQHILSTIPMEELPAPLAAPLLGLLAEAQLARGATHLARLTLPAIEAALSACPIPQQAELCYQLGRLRTLLGEDGRPYFRRSVELDPHGRYARDAWRGKEQPDVGFQKSA